MILTLPEMSTIGWLETPYLAAHMPIYPETDMAPKLGLVNLLPCSYVNEHLAVLQVWYGVVLYYSVV